MDVRARIVIAISLLLGACGPADRAETIMPAQTETCGGSALKTQYIVHMKNGQWAYIRNPDREDFKENFVRPKIDEIEFIEYDQKISARQSSGEIPISPIHNWGTAAIGADRFWQKGHRGQNVIVAVVDSGIDTTHPLLSSRILTNPGEGGALSSNGVDDDQNGFVDDYLGFNFYTNNSVVNDTEGHGTHVAGIIAAHHTDTLLSSHHIQGVAPEAKLLAVPFLGADGGTLSAALKGIDYAVSRGANIINASWGSSGCSLSLREKMTELSNKNVLFVVAAGNSGADLDRYPEFPAAFNLPLQITVGALSERLNLDYYSNYSQKFVHIFAPGTSIISTAPSNSYVSMSGTSMATPFVSASAALLLGAKPDLSLQEVRTIILKYVEADTNYVNATRGRLSLEKIADALGL